MPISLKLDLSATFGYPLALELTPWNQGISWINHVNEQQFQNDYFEDNGLSLSFLSNLPPNQAWWLNFPNDVFQALIDFEQRFVDHTFSTLWFLSRSQAACQLLLSAPTLLWMIIDYAKSQQLDAEDVFPYFSIKRTDICALFNLPPKKSTLNILNKYQCQKFGHGDISLIRDLCKRFNPIDLSRISLLHKPLAEWLLTDPNLIHFRVIQQLKADDTRLVRIQLRDSLAMVRELRLPQINQQLQSSPTPIGIDRIHDRLVTLINQKEQGEFINTTYPTAPIEAGDNMMQITHRLELVDEGKIMRHCIASYHPRLLNGTYFVFKLLVPERATIGLHYVRGRLTIDQIRLTSNAKPSAATEELVYWWLQNYA